jgi:hypothetical protein
MDDMTLGLIDCQHVIRGVMSVVNCHLELSSSQISLFKISLP